MLSDGKGPMKLASLAILAAVSAAIAQPARTPAYVTTGIFIGAIEEGARIFTPGRLLPFEHPEALGHQFPTVQQLNDAAQRVRASGPAILVYQRPTTPVGIWRGTSVCLVRPSACKDEVVVYRIARTNTVDSLTVDARKIVRGEEQEMGVLTCRFTSPNGLTCVIAHGTWLFRVRNDSLIGELRLPDNTKFRDVRATRAPAS